MLLGGLQKTTLIDFPGRVACTVFTVGCDFRCPFCHNKDLVTLKLFKESGIKPLKEKDFFNFLKKRKKILDGVCITGGEPTLQPDLINFCKEIKELGLEIKLDTNGSQPKILKQLINKKLIDFVAIDVKSSFQDYKKATGVNFSILKIKKSIKLVLKSGLEYELRTTVVPGIHNKTTLLKTAKELKSLDNNISWTLQQFRPKNCLDKDYLKIKPFTNQELKLILKSVKVIVTNTKLRGED